MKLLVLSSQAFSVRRFCMDMLREAQRRGFEVVVCVPDADAAFEAAMRGADVRYLPIDVERTGENPLHDLRTYRSLRAVIAREKPDAVLCYQAKTVIYGTLAAHREGVRRVYAMIWGLGSAFRVRERTPKRVLVKMYLTLAYRAALRRATLVFFQNPDDSGAFLRARIVGADKVRMMHGSGVNLADFPPAPMPEARRFVFVGRLIRDKGILEYLEAARAIRRVRQDMTFQVVGYFDTNPSALKESDLAPYFEDGSAEFLGKRDDVAPILADAYAFVLPSYHEGTPKSALEAMAVGRPVIVTDAPGCRETVRGGENGMLVPVGDARALADAMTRLADDPALAARMGAASLRFARELFDADKVNAALFAEMER